MELDIRAVAEKLIGELNKEQATSLEAATRAHARAEGIAMLFDALVEENAKLQAKPVADATPTEVN